MAWTTPTTVNAGDKLTSTLWNNEVVGNLNYLLSPNKAVVIHNNGSDYTTTSTTFVDVDATNLSLTITTHGGPVLVVAVCKAMNGNGFGAGGLDITMDGTRIGANTTLGLADVGNVYMSYSLVALVSPSAGSHTFRLQFRADAGTTTVYSNSTLPVVMAAIEL